MAEVGSAYVSVLPSARGFGRRLDAGIGPQLTKSGATAGKKFGGAFSSTLKTTAGLGAGLGIAGLVKSSVQLQASFGKTMALVAASTGAPKSAIASLRAEALKLGAQTKFSANEAADAMLGLGKSGISTADILGGALKGTLLLAAAGDTDLATATTIASNAMNTFNLRGKDMSKIAAALAGGANASSASVESLGEALGQVGPGATNAGLSLQETVGVLSAFDAAGIKGSDAGTSLKTMLARLVPQTDKAAKAMKSLNLDFTDAQGNFLPITKVAGQLQKSLKGLSQEQRSTALTTIFGSDATRAATVLMNEGAAGIAKYVKATNDQNAAQRMAKANMSGTAGALERLRGSVETAQLALGEALAPTVTKVSNYLSTKAVPAFSKFVKGMQDGTGAGGDLASTVGDIFTALKPIGALVVLTVKTFSGLPGSAQKVLVLAAAALVLKNRFGDAIPTLQSFTREGAIAATKTLAIRGGALAAGVGLATLASKAGGAETALGGLATIGAGIATGFAVGGPWGAAIGGGAAAMSVFASRSNAAATAQAKVEAGAARAASTLNQQTGALTKLSRATFAQSLADAGAFTAARKVGASYNDVLDAALGNEAAMKRVNAANDAYLRGVPKAGEAAVKMRRNVETLSGAIGANSSQLAKQRNRISQVNEALDEAGKKHPKPIVLLNTSEFTASLKYVIASMNKIGRLSATAKANLHASDVGNNAKGTDNWRGGLTWVGEDGPELINLAKHAQVIPNNKIGDVSNSRSAVGSLDSLSPAAIRAALDGMSMDVRLTGGDRAKAQFVQEGIKAGARL